MSCSGLGMGLSFSGSILYLSLHVSWYGMETMLDCGSFFLMLIAEDEATWD